MKRFLIATGVVLIAGAAVAIMAASSFVSTQRAKTEIAERISAWAGTPVTLQGDPVVTFFPAARIVVEDVTVSGADGAEAPLLVTIPSLEASLRILPLLSGRMELGAVTLVNPHIQLVADEDGGNNWSTDGDQTSGVLDAVSSRLGGARPGEIVLRDGVITYEERHARGATTVEVTDFRFAWQDATQTGELSGTFTLCGKTTGTESRPEQSTELVMRKRRCGQPAAAATETKNSSDDDTGFDAAGTPLGERYLLGLPLRRFVEWLGIPVTTDSFGPFHVVGKFKVDRTSMALSEATFDFDGNAAEGDLTFRPGKERPALEGSLAFEKLNLTPYLARLQPPNMSAIELLALPVSAEWLALADVDLEISADEIGIGLSQFTETTLDIVARDGRMRLALKEAGLAGGHMEGHATVAPIENGIAARLSATLDDVAVGDASRFIWSAGAHRLIRVDAPLRGTGTGSLDLSMEGATVGELLKSLSGWSAAEIQDGTVAGVDLAATLDGLVAENTAIADGEAPFLPKIGKTPFHLLKTYMTFDAGTARAREFLFRGDRFEVTLSGKGELEGGEIEAAGTAVLLTTASDDEASDNEDAHSHPVVELPFGVGGTLLGPVIAPGIPRIAHREESAAVPLFRARPRFAGVMQGR